MRYMSDDGKVFNTEQDCYEYEKRIEADKVKREKLEMERQNKIDVISKRYEELQNLLSEYEKDFGVRQRPYVAPFYEILDMLCG